MTSPLRLIVRRTSGPFRVPEVRATRVSLRLPSEVGCIEEAVALVERHCFAGVDPVDRRLRFRLQVALSEALANAIICGNREHSDRAVLVEAELLGDFLRLTITDEGDGFDPAAVPDPMAPERLEHTCGRGLFLIRELVDHVSFNERGNSICMTLRRR